MITVPQRVSDAIEDIRSFLDVQDMDDVRIEITSKGTYVQVRDAIRTREDRRSA